MTNRPQDSWITSFFAEDYLRLYRDEEFLPADLTAQELELVAHFVPPGSGPVLEMACGYGRHTVPLAELGYDLWSFDLSPIMVSAASEAVALTGKDEGHSIFRGDMLALPFAENSFAWTLLLFNSFGYLGAEQSFRAGEPASIDLNGTVLREISRVLKPGGRALVDLPNRAPLVELVKETPVILHGTDGVKLQESFEYSASAKVLANRSILWFGDEPRKESEYFLRLYSREEFAELANQAGLKIITLLGEYDGAAYEESESSRMIAILAKLES